MASTIDALNATRIATVVSGNLLNQGQAEAATDIHFGVPALEVGFEDTITISLAIEGYVLASCPPGYNGDNLGNPSAPQRLYRRRSYVDQSSALLLESQLSLPAFASYATDAWGGGSGLLGYVFPNVDTDCDGIVDGIEFPVAGVQATGHDPRSGPCDP